MHSEQPQIIAIGGMHVDDIAIPLRTLRTGMSIPVKWQKRVGGVAANAARVAGRSVSTTLYAAIGDDTAAQALVNAFAEDAVRLEPVLFRGQATGRYTVVLDESGELHIGLSSVELAERLTFKCIENLLPSHTPDAVILDANLSEDALVGLTTYFEHTGDCSIVALPVSPAKATRLIHCAAQIDLLICNRNEAAELAGSLDIQGIAFQLNKLGFNNCIVTDSSEPITLLRNGSIRSIEITHSGDIQQAVNGAGDALAGATIAAWTQGIELEQAVKHYGLQAAYDVLSGAWVAPELY
ncbi:MAG: hypothetical protein KTR35_19475 [Gammaproteobacteria bacterium]|nr:hypothetical protein [Gammaproteobacteria bacterium]